MGEMLSGKCPQLPFMRTGWLPNSAVEPHSWCQPRSHSLAFARRPRRWACAVISSYAATTGAEASVIIPRTQALGVLGLMLLGVWSLSQGLFVLLSLLGMAFTPSSESFDMAPYLYSQAFVVSVYAVVGAGLVLLRYPLAAALLARDGEAESDGLDPARLEVFAIALVGLWFVVQAILGEVHHESSLLLGWASADSSIGYPQPSVEARWSPRLTNLAEAAIGLALLLGASGAHRTWSLLRHAGHDRSSSPDGG